MPDTMLAPSLHLKIRLLQLDGPQTNISAIPEVGGSTHIASGGLRLLRLAPNLLL